LKETAMPTTEHLRWHLALALGGALLVERLHGQFALALILAVVADRVVTLAVLSLRPRAGRPSPPPDAPKRDQPEHRDRPTRWRATSLSRVIGADCGTCRGFGCRTCAYTGLS